MNHGRNGWVGHITAIISPCLYVYASPRCTEEKSGSTIEAGSLQAEGGI